MVVATNGATTLAGSSMALSSAADRRRFHQIRALAASVAIGGSTFRSEPYTDLRLPVYVASKTLSPTSGIHIYNESPVELVLRAFNEHGAPVLVEGGIGFLGPLLDQSMVDRLYLTRAATAGDGGFVNISQFLNCYQFISKESESGEDFEIWEPKEPR